VGGTVEVRLQPCTHIRLLVVVFSYGKHGPQKTHAETCDSICMTEYQL